MFTRPINENKIPPNFLNSILTNDSLYQMFKNEFDENSEYFQNINKDEYLYSMMKFICDKLESGNLFQIYDSENLDETINRSSVLKYMRTFYDDFMLPLIKQNKENIFDTPFFKSLKYAEKHDEYASLNASFNEFVNYVFNESIDYFASEEEIKKNLKEKLSSSHLSIQEFDLLCNYVKNNITGIITMDFACCMIKNHAYKSNHIFDRDVVKGLLYSTCFDYLKVFGIKPNIEYTDNLYLLKNVQTHDISSSTIYIDNLLIDTFISGNYVELFKDLFYKMDLLKEEIIINSDIISYDALNTVMKIVNFKVDITRIFKDESYYPYGYYTDASASAFLKTLKFYQTLGVDLFSNYINSQIDKVDYNKEGSLTYKKEIGQEILFLSKFPKLSTDRIMELKNKYSVLKIIFQDNGVRKKAIDLLKSIKKEQNKSLIFKYLMDTIPNPEDLIDDVIDLSNFKSTKDDINELVVRLLKYIYPDTFYYSLDSYIKLNTSKSSFNKREYLDDLYVRVSCIKDIPSTNKFKISALDIIEDMK